MKQRNPQQIIRFDGKNVFMEVMNNAFNIGKVQINFMEYNTNAEVNSRITKNLPIYIDIHKFMVLANDILSGKMSKLAQEAIQAKEKGNYRFAKEIYTDLGGISAENLKNRDKARPDGKSLSRQFKITPGDKAPWILSAEYGAGEENETGLIVPKGRPEESLRVPLQDDDFKKFAIVVMSHIHSFHASQYAKEQLNQQTESLTQQIQELKTELEQYKPVMRGLYKFLQSQGVQMNMNK
ncbi:hypothetical protein PP175_27550 (plasmid) [Aneurinibacillus sp. Ricciae_BoGa-3]|uniref:hypothetical protein n=1 Tax=Aneurinibacillus sp. Ricciae_BoGa-3 TaxID=3022697 RepID=UPI00233F7EBE|nr:hypothetical protein [Aneurinibacillus sp. Ricciae_BoGa-3]WCK56949.1 hypothetical protein PP175_27550 [Aneurinibacillus sp. Ricciae_BoGa-3]